MNDKYKAFTLGVIVGLFAACGVTLVVTLLFPWERVEYFPLRADGKAALRVIPGKNNSVINNYHKD